MTKALQDLHVHMVVLPSFRKTNCPYLSTCINKYQNELIIEVKHKLLLQKKSIAIE